MRPMQKQANNPLHGITLEMMLNRLVESYGWDELAARIRIRCFARDPSVKSSLAFLRRTPWARAKVEGLYLSSLKRERKPAIRKPAAKKPATKKPPTT